MPAAAIPLGVIHADESYPLPRFLALTGLGRKSFTRAKHDGLVVSRVGRRVYVLGKHWHDYLQQSAKK